MANAQVKLTRRGMLFKIARLVTNYLIKGNYYLPHIAEISAEDLHAQINKGQEVLLIDTRPAQEFGSGFGHIPNSKHVPLMEMLMTFPKTTLFKAAVKKLEAQFNEIESFKGKEVVTICPGGGFSMVAADIMAEAGFKNVKSLKGGADGWFKKGYPTTKS